MTEYVSNQQGIPLATNGYVSAVTDKIVKQTVLSDGKINGASLSLKEISKVAFSVSHSIVRMRVASIGGMNQTVRSQVTTLNVGTKGVRLGVNSDKLGLSLSKN